MIDGAEARGPAAPRPYDVTTYGERIADVYDHLPRLPASTERAVEFLAAAARRGPILELGIATGRLALPLVQRGLAVHGIDAVHLETSVHDPVAQRVRSQQVVINERGVRMYPVEIRYAWPSELDLMARLAGLRLRERWGGWGREAFDASSGAHVSVYERAR